MLIFFIFSIVILIFFYICEKSKINVLVTFLITIIITYLVIFPKSSIESVSSGTNLFIKSVFPTLFPFLILTNILINYGGINIFGKLFGKLLIKPLKISKNSIFPLMVSFICGYPLGTKYLNDLHNKNLISNNEFQRMINIASNASPLFLIGTVGVSMLNNKTLGYILLIANYLSCILISFLTPYKKDILTNELPKSTNTKNNFGEILKASLENAIKTCSIVGGFIILFSLIKEILINNIYSQILFNNFPILKSLVIGFFEITNGINLLSQTNISIPLKLSIISALCAFSGICIILQCYSFVYKNQSFKLNKYIFYKLIQSIISFIITYISCIIFT